MPWFEIVYSEEATGEPVSQARVVARDRTEAAAAAMNGFAKAQSTHKAKFYRILDQHGMVVARGPRALSSPEIARNLQC